LMGYIIAAIILLLILMLCLKIQVEIKIIIKNGKNYSFIIMRIFRGLLRLRFNLSLIPSGISSVKFTIRKTDSKMEKQSSVKDISRILMRSFDIYKNYNDQLRYMKSKMKVYNLSLQANIGTGDAAATALICGGTFAFFYTFAYFLKEKYNLQNQQIVVVPNFQRPYMDLDLDCIINFKLGHIIIAGMKVLTSKLEKVIYGG